MASFSPFQSSSSTIPTPAIQVARGAQPCHMPDTMSPKKAALLIGICDKKTLKGPHTDVEMMRALLVDVYGYAPENITVLLDDEQDGHVQPTKNDILKAIDNLVRDARAGDQFFFHFAGHAGQGEAINLEEEDGKDEFIYTSDEGSIQDDVLYERLVKPLPPKAKLTAIMDACHSGTILDLKHHKCNQVYVPWISKGPRHSKTLWSRVVKKNGIIVTDSLKSTSVDEIPIAPPVANIQPPCVATKRSTPLSIITNIPSNLEDNHILDSPGHNVECSSPVPNFCDGFTCRKSSPNAEELECADVICLSSSQDSQLTWEKNGVSMSQILVNFLRQNPNPVLHNLMMHICHTIHQAMVDLHDQFRDYEQKMRIYNAKRLKPRLLKNQPSCIIPGKRKHKPSTKSEESKRSTKFGKGNNGRHIQSQKPVKSAPVAVAVETINFQDPVLSSHLPLDMKNRHWDM